MSLDGPPSSPKDGWACDPVRQCSGSHRWRMGGVEARTSLEKRALGYQLNVDDADVDVGRFLQENAEGVRAAAARRFEEASRYLAAALGEWRGPVLEDLRQYEFIEAFAVAFTE